MELILKAQNLYFHEAKETVFQETVYKEEYYSTFSFFPSEVEGQQLQCKLSLNGEPPLVNIRGCRQQSLKRLGLKKKNEVEIPEILVYWVGREDNNFGLVCMENT